jgi:hypothetical protein
MVTAEGAPCSTVASGTHVTSNDGNCHAGTCVSYLSSCQRYGILSGLFTSVPPIRNLK